jgi:hypothetical protein
MISGINSTASAESEQFLGQSQEAERGFQRVLAQCANLSWPISMLVVSFGLMDITPRQHVASALFPSANSANSAN